jgi:hypothetical protein
LRAGGALFSWKYALVESAGLLNEAALIAFGIPLRELYDFAHLISKEATSGENKKANIVPNVSALRAALDATGSFRTSRDARLKSGIRTKMDVHRTL